MPDDVALQDLGWATEHGCFGCGPDNPEGLRIRSYRDGAGGWVTTWAPGRHHVGPPGAVQGGLVAVPMDCTAAFAAMDVFRSRAGLADDEPGSVYAVTGEYTVRLLAPTPVDGPLEVRATAGAPDGRRLRVEATTSWQGQVTATFTGTMFEVRSADA